MNRHLKLSILLLPFLAIIGFIASDIYLENQANKLKIFQLTQVGQCDITNGQCLLNSGELKINLSANSSGVILNASFPLDKATLFIVDKDKMVTAYPLNIENNRYYWQHESVLTNEISTTNLTLRLIAEIKGGKYIAEFVTVNTN